MFLIPNIEHFTRRFFTSYTPKNLPNPNAFNRFTPIINRDSKTDKITIEVHFSKKLLKREYTYGIKFTSNDLKIVVERFAKELEEYAVKTYSKDFKVLEVINRSKDIDYKNLKPLDISLLKEAYIFTITCQDN